MSSKDDPTDPAFWNVRFRENRTPWDAGSAPPQLERYLAGERGGGRVLIPGCGSAYEVRSFEDNGYEVVAIDFSAAAVERAAAELGPLSTAVILGDFFTYDFGDRRFDIVYERAFLASMPPKLWPAYAARVARLLRPGGRLIGFFAYGGRHDGPPFFLDPGELQALLGAELERVEELAVTASVPVFENKERWEVWSRK